MGMKTKQIAQWIMFVAVFIAGLVFLGMGIGSLSYLLVPGSAAIASGLSSILCLAFGVVWGYGGVLAWIELAEQGWFFKEKE